MHVRPSRVWGSWALWIHVVEHRLLIILIPNCFVSFLRSFWWIGHVADRDRTDQHDSSSVFRLPAKMHSRCVCNIRRCRGIVKNVIRKSKNPKWFRIRFWVENFSGPRFCHHEDFILWCYMILCDGIYDVDEHRHSTDLWICHCVYDLFKIVIQKTSLICIMHCAIQLICTPSRLRRSGPKNPSGLTAKAWI